MQGPSWQLQGGVFGSKDREKGESSDGYQKKWVLVHVHIIIIGMSKEQFSSSP